MAGVVEITETLDDAVIGAITNRLEMLGSEEGLIFEVAVSMIREAKEDIGCGGTVVYVLERVGDRESGFGEFWFLACAFKFPPLALLFAPFKLELKLFSVIDGLKL